MTSQFIIASHVFTSRLNTRWARAVVYERDDEPLAPTRVSADTADYREPLDNSVVH
jgi:hypothetical protein